VNPKAREKRFARLKFMGCIACWMDGVMAGAEIHHLNLGGKAGQKRRGDEYTIPLCPWHHQGRVECGHTATSMREVRGPSLARQSREFRAKYGTDDEILAHVDDLIRQLDGYAQAPQTEAEVSGG
jgi:hypothetical protein